jgi:hypothetical protein
MIRRVRYAILALLILGVFAAGAALDWSASIRTEVSAIELQPAPPPLLTGKPAAPIARTSPAKAKSADRKSRSVTPEVRPVSPPEPARTPSRIAVGSTPARESSPRASSPVASTSAPKKAPNQTPTTNVPAGGRDEQGGDDGGTPAPAPPTPTNTPAPGTPTTTGAAPAPAPPEPAGDDDDGEEGDDDDGDDGGDDD